MQSKIKVKLLDIGGEGRYQSAWNLNPRSQKTIGHDLVLAIPNLILGRAECIPLPDGCVQRIMMERAPLRRAAVFEMVRVIVPGGTIILRHNASTALDPHGLAQQLINADFSVQKISIGCQELQQTRFDNVRGVRRDAFWANPGRLSKQGVVMGEITTPVTAMFAHTRRSFFKKNSPSVLTPYHSTEAIIEGKERVS